MKQISDLSDKVFKVIFIKMLSELGRRMEELNENFDKGLEKIINNK